LDEEVVEQKQLLKAKVVEIMDGSVGDGQPSDPRSLTALKPKKLLLEQ
jgi:hypothetical protein